MRNQIKNFGLFILMTFAILSCEKTDENSKADGIVYRSINEEFVLIRDVKTLRESNDEVSNHVDSILSGLINEEFVSTGQKEYQLDDDLISDIGFEIIDLNLYNPDGLPESFDSLAVRSIPKTVEILDNSTHGYPDALNLNDKISKNGSWSDHGCVLGTFMNAGKFQGQGEKYLAIRFIKEDNYKYGWIKIYCSQHNDTLRIIDYAFNNKENRPINAGQKE